MVAQEVVVIGIHVVEAVTARTHIVDAAGAAHVLQVQAPRVVAGAGLIVVQLAQRCGVQTETGFHQAFIQLLLRLYHVQLGRSEAVHLRRDRGLHGQHVEAHGPIGHDGVDGLRPQVLLLCIGDRGVEDPLDHVLTALPLPESHASEAEQRDQAEGTLFQRAHSS